MVIIFYSYIISCGKLSLSTEKIDKKLQKCYHTWQLRGEFHEKNKIL